MDDHEIVRMGLRALFAQKPGWEVCAEVGDGRTAIAEVLSSKPDVVILDLLLEGEMSGFGAAATIRQIAPYTKLIFFSLHEVPATARTVGADAFVSKASGAVELLGIIERLTSGPAGSEPLVKGHAASD